MMAPTIEGPDGSGPQPAEQVAPTVQEPCGIFQIIPPDELSRIATRPTKELEFWMTLFAMAVIIISGFHAVRWCMEMAQAHGSKAHAPRTEAQAWPMVSAEVTAEQVRQ